MRSRATTWLLRVIVLAVILLGLRLTTMWWVPGLAHGLTCDERVTRADAIIIDNLDANYLLFERVAEMTNPDDPTRVLVPAEASPEGATDLISAGIVSLMANTARLSKVEAVPVSEVEPITLNVAKQMRTFLQREQLHSVQIVTPALRSRRTALVYSRVFEPAGIETACEPVGRARAAAWSRSWHGVQEVVEQYGKLGYYRLYVLPFLMHDANSRT